MTATCPNGHPSTTSDYCDNCGAKIGGDQAVAAAPGGTPAPPPVPTPDGTAGLCPNCQSPYGPDEKFCEVCGYDFAAGTLPAAPVPVPAAEPAGAQGVAGSRDVARSRGVAPPGPTWEAVVAADRDYYERTSPDEVAFPDDYPERVFTLAEDEILIGRRSTSRQIHPQIDLSGTPEDSGVSRSHAVLRRLADGTWTVVDPGSTNGTRLNNEPAALERGVAVPLKDGDRIYLGAWTRITLRAPAASGGEK